MDRGILIAGGHARFSGGLEIFARRATDCLTLAKRKVSLFRTETPGAPGQGLREYLGALAFFPFALRRRRVVWLQYGSIFDLAFLAIAKACGRKVAVTPHLGSGWRSQRNPILRAVSNRTLMLADAVFALYRAQAEDLRFPSALKRKCRPMPTFLPPEVLATGPAAPRDKKRLRLLHVARLSAEKGTFAFLAVCADLKRRGVAFEAAIVGHAEPELRARIEGEIARNGLVGGVALLPFMAPERLSSFMRGFDVLVNLSVQDAYPLTVLEALGCGLAAVCTALPGTREMAADFAGIRLVEGQDAKRATERVCAAARRPADQRGKLRTMYGWPAVGARYGEALDALGEKTPPRRRSVRTGGKAYQRNVA
jgi:glycosyltransferase involved in cell wall biosynthesis